jgi:hypothetical protein
MLHKQKAQQQHEENLFNFAIEIEKLVNEPAIMARFKDQRQTFDKMVASYYNWFAKQEQFGSKEKSYQDNGKLVPPQNGLIWEGSGGFWREPDREDLPNYLNWFPPKANRLWPKPDSLEARKRRKREGVRPLTDKESLMVDYVTLAIVHDAEFPEHPIYEANENESDPLAGTYKYFYEIEKNYPKDKDKVRPRVQTRLELAFENVETDLTENPTEAEQKIEDSGTPATGEPADIEQKKASGERWSRPMTKNDIITVLHLDSIHKLNQLVEHGFHSVKQVGNNRQSWQIRIDKLESDIQKKLI